MSHACLHEFELLLWDVNRAGNLALLLGLALFGGFAGACGTESPAPSAVGTGGQGATASGAGGTTPPTGGASSGASGASGTSTGGAVSGGGGVAPTGGASGTAGVGAGAGSGMGGVGMSGAAGSVNQGGSGAVAGAGASAGAGGGATGNCTFTVSSQTADKAGSGGIPTVGIVSWSVDLTGLTMANISFGLDGATPMTAPVDPAAGPMFRTLLLGMKGSRTYTFRINVSNGTTQCQSQPYTIMTGAVSNQVPRITRTAGASASAAAKGFFVTSTGLANMGGGGSAFAFIFDSDGDPVWWAPAPPSCSRAKMSYEGTDMWAMALNVQNGQANGGRVDRISMDGLTRMQSVTGMSNCHHDLTTLPGGKVACPSWIRQSGDQPSDIIERDAQGNITTFLRIDQTVYVGGSGAGGGTGTFHANAIHYNAADDTYIVADRNPNLLVKVARTGVVWQLGGSCTSAPATRCVAGSWRVNHGFHRPDATSILFFNNGTSGASTAFKYTINDSGTTCTATEAWQYRPGTTSNVLGDVQQLPNGNVVVTFSTAGVIQEIDSSRTLVQSFNVGVAGYSEWRETLYGPPPAGR